MSGVSGVAGTILAGLVVRPNKGAQHWFQRQIDSKKKIPKIGTQ